MASTNASTSNSKSTRRALLASVMALLLCFSTLAGTTYAWFTDSASTGVNTIQAGNLKMGAYWYNTSAEGGAAWTAVDQNTAVFSDATLWEPGHTEIAYFKVANEGSLAFDYKVNANILSETGSKNVNGEAFTLSTYLRYALVSVSSNQVGALSRSDAQKLIKSESALKTDSIDGGTLKATADDQYVAIVVYMPESVGNEANYKEGAAVPTISMGINFVAKQATVESDSYSDDYDEGAAYPVVSDPINLSNTGAVSTTGDTTIDLNVETAGANGTTVKTKKASITIPSGATSVNNVAFSVETTEVAANSTTLEISLKDADSTSSDSITLSSAATVTVQLEKNLENVTVLHKGKDVTTEGGTVSYNASTGVLTFTTKSFSPFKITYDFDPVATLNGESYASINAAINAAKDGDTVYLQKDLESSDSRLINLCNSEGTRGSKNITVDLGGHYINSSGAAQVVQVAYNQDKLILKNGTIVNSGGGNAVACFPNSNLTLENVTVSVSGEKTNTYPYALSLKGNVVNVDNCTVEVAKGYGIVAAGSSEKINVNNTSINVTASDWNNGSVDNRSAGVLTLGTIQNTEIAIDKTTINSQGMGIFGQAIYSKYKITNSEINSSYFGVYQNGAKAPSEFDIDNCTISNTKCATDHTGAGIYISNGADKEKQTLKVSNSSVTGNTAIEVKHTNATIKDSTLNATGDLNVVPYGSGQCTSGYGIAVTSNGSSENASGVVSLTGCTISAKQDAFVFTLAEGSSAKIGDQDIAQSASYVVNATVKEE